MRVADMPWCECNNERARRILRAECVPRRTMLLSSLCCSWSNTTRYFIGQPSIDSSSVACRSGGYTRRTQRTKHSHELTWSSTSLIGPLQGYPLVCK